MIADDPQEFTFQEQEYLGTISGQTVRKELEIGGFDEAPEMTLVIPIRDAQGAPTFVTLPAVGDRITIGTKDYRVDKTEIDQFNAGFQMDLRSVNK